MNLDRRCFLAGIPVLCAGRWWSNAPQIPAAGHPHAALFVYTEPKLGATEVAPVADVRRELVVWGTDRVFRFPEIPAGLTPGRGRA